MSVILSNLNPRHPHLPREWEIVELPLLPTVDLVLKNTNKYRKY